MKEERVILSERYEDQIKTVEWIRNEYKRLQKEKADMLSKKLQEEMTPIILNNHSKN